MGDKSIFVSCVRWVRRGVAESVPTKIELTKEELKSIITAESKSIACKDIESKERENTSNDDEIENKYNFNRYDEEDSIPMTLGSVYTDFIDPSATNDDEGDESDEDDRILPEDNLILVSHIDKDTCILEVYVHNPDDDYLYVHHDIILPDYPLCLEWVGLEPMSQGASGNLCAVGSMSPIIQMWDIDIVNCLEPACKLGKKPKTKKGQERVGHSKAVLDLSWNTNLPHILASASADETVLLWDLDSGLPDTILSSFSEKVQTLKWHPFEGHMLLTGSCDKIARVFDCRSDNTFKQWSLDGEVERVIWNHFNPFDFLACTDTGNIYYMDCRQDIPLWMEKAHSSAVTGLTLSANCPGLLTTASMDGDIKIWDIAATNETPVCVAVQKSRVGPVLCLEFCPDSPFVICAGGHNASCYFSTWDLLKKDEVRSTFSSRQLLQTETVTKSRDGDVKHSEVEQEESEENTHLMRELHNNKSRFQERSHKKVKIKKLKKNSEGPKVSKTSPPYKAVSVKKKSSAKGKRNKNILK